MSVASNPGPSRVVRYLESRGRLAYLLVGLGVAFFVLRAVQQMADPGINRVPDFFNLYDAARDMSGPADPYRLFLNTCPSIVLGGLCPRGYLYPPLLAELFRPIALLPPASAARVWLGINYVATVVLVYVVFRTVGDRLQAPGRALLLAAFLFFVPLYQNFYFLQMNLVLTLLLALTAWAFVRGRGSWAAIAGGASLGTAVVMRLTPAVVVPVLLRARSTSRWLVATGAVIVGLVGALLAMSPRTAEYFRDVLPRLSPGTVLPANQSLVGLSLRAQVLIAGTVLPWAQLLTSGVAAALVVVTTVVTLRIRDERSRAVGFASFLAAMPIVSSLTWEIHLIPEMLAVALVAPSLATGGRHWWAVVAAYLLVWAPRPDLVSLAFGTAHGLAAIGYLLATSLNLLGMTILWITCMSLLARARANVREA